MEKSNKLINTMIATGVALCVLSVGLATLYKYKNPKISWTFTGLALAETACVGGWVWLKEKSKQK